MPVRHCCHTLSSHYRFGVRASNSVAAIVRASRARAALQREQVLWIQGTLGVLRGFCRLQSPITWAQASSVCPVVRREFVQRVSQRHDECQDSRIWPTHRFHGRPWTRLKVAWTCQCFHATPEFIAASEEFNGSRPNIRDLGAIVNDDPPRTSSTNPYAPIAPACLPKSASARSQSSSGEPSGHPRASQ